MSHYWTSPQTGITYDTTNSDAFGNWAVVSGAGALSAAGGAAFVLGSIGLLTSYIVVVLAFFPFMLALGFARYPFLPLLLLIVALLLLVLPEGRRHRTSVWAAAAVSLVMVPVTILSMWSLSNVGSGLYAWAASIPFVPAVALGLAIWAPAKRIWPAMLLYGGMFAASSLWNLVAWLPVWTSTPMTRTPPAAGPMGIDNILAVGMLVVVSLVARVVAAQVAVWLEKRRAERSVMQADAGTVA